MTPGAPDDVAALVVATAAARVPLAGGGRVVCIDGPAGSGKTTLAAQVVRLTGAEQVHMDDLMAGWQGGVDTGAAVADVIVPWARGQAGSYRRYDWHAGHFAATVSVEPGPWLVVEGVGSGRAALLGDVTVLVWVEVDDDLRLARGIDRDGADLEPRWREFMAAERGLFARERTRDRADILVDGTGQRPAVLR